MEDKFNYELEDKINLIYDYVYNINTKSCFNIDKIKKGPVLLILTLKYFLFI